MKNALLTKMPGNRMVVNWKSLNVQFGIFSRYDISLFVRKNLTKQLCSLLSQRKDFPFPTFIRPVVGLIIQDIPHK